MRLAKINTSLLVLIVVVNLYVIITPFLPALLFAKERHGGTYQALTHKIESPPPESGSKPASNSITIPAMLLDQPILEGRDTYAVLNKGILHWSGSSTPDKGGNTVLVGHRFTYTVPKGVFYQLDKVHVGDSIGITWNSRNYRYRVTNIKTVPPSDTSILRPTTNPSLTMYTCTPLWHPKQRLVVIAELESKP